ncbi:AAA family ATPase [Bacillus solitudinis]|uniref:AAA family ATPase n=1 Tax=Bacillus solitudinis TaxID=2014074 RepID=UPI000C2411AA|nr:SMC family ATPase [Bacillus solitudinis]
MKPKKITITAFGPYKKKEMIDFDELKEHRLFVISGNTGAGKTSIFDAICFALYGEASGEDRNEPRMLRSQFASEDDHTSVDYIFEIRSRTYRVFRQMAHIKGKNKTPSGDKYELYEIIDNKEVLLVDRLNVTTVNQKIHDIIGLTKAQFSQIVMLPQGEFRKLLTSETENKEEILRKIFKTGLFKSMTERLNDKRIEAQKKYEDIKKERDIIINNIENMLPKREDSLLTHVFEQENFNTHQVLEALSEEMTHYIEVEIKQKKLIDGHFQAFQEKNTHYHLAKSANDRFDVLDEKRQQKLEMDEQQPRMNELEQKYQQAEKASRISVYEGHYLDISSELTVLNDSLEKANTEGENAKIEFASSQKVYEAEEAKEKEREQAAFQVKKLHDYIADVEGLDEKKKIIDRLSKEGAELKKNAEQYVTKLKATKLEKINLQNQMRDLEQKVKLLPEKSEAWQETKSKLRLLNECVELTDKKSKLSSQLFSKEQAFGDAKAEYNLIETRWIEGQASLLAVHLHDGEACPVCGSHDHPSKAELELEIPTKDQLDQKRSDLAKVEEAFRKLQADLSSVISQATEKEQDLETFAIESNEISIYREKEIEVQQQLQVEIEQLKQDQEALEQLKGKYENVELIIEQVDSQKERNEKQWNEIRSNYKTEQALYEEKVKIIPEHLQTVETLNNEITIAEQLTKTLEHQWKTAQEQLNVVKERHLTIKTTIEHLNQQIEKTSKKQEKALNIFNAALTEAHFETKEAYKLAKIPDVTREALKTEIDTFKTNLASLRKQITELEMELKEKQRENLLTLQSELVELENQLGERRKELMQTENLLTTTKRAHSDILIASEKVGDAETKFLLHKDLYDVVRGDNQRKVSFERYLQIEFLEQIVQEANQRLHRLSNGQFHLIRSERLEKRGKQSGLSLDVYDNYTGQNRDVKSLSGGEKFNASLSLALGMVDVIQSHQGGISIETMFIDEGFGSLDEETLNKAIDTLIDLQKSGRLVGVISHVHELKQAIPAILDVRKTKEGHSQTTFIIK